MKPILFNTEMVGAILDGSKTMTRRVCKELDKYEFSWGLDREPYIGDYKTFAKTGARKWDWVTLKDVWLYDLQTEVDDSKSYLLKPPYQPGDILWVRETWFENEECLLYKASKYENTKEYHGRNGWVQIKWRPSIFMPREAARIFLRVTNVRVERLQDITEEQAEKEGYKKKPIDCQTTESAKVAFWAGWNSIYAKSGYGWGQNPWVWVIEFERVEKP